MLSFARVLFNCGYLFLTHTHMNLGGTGLQHGLTHKFSQSGCLNLRTRGLAWCSVGVSFAFVQNWFGSLFCMFCMCQSQLGLLPDSNEHHRCSAHAPENPQACDIYIDSQQVIEEVRHRQNMSLFAFSRRGRRSGRERRIHSSVLYQLGFPPSSLKWTDF